MRAAAPASVRRERKHTILVYLYRVARPPRLTRAPRPRQTGERADHRSSGDEAEVVIEPPSPPGRRSARVDRETASRIQETMRRLPDNRRRAVGLHLRGFTSTEIGCLLGWSEPKARNLTHRGLKDLRALLQMEGIGLP